VAAKSPDNAPGGVVSILTPEQGPRVAPANASVMEGMKEFPGKLTNAGPIPMVDRSRDHATPKEEPSEPDCYVGEFRADYSPLSQAEREAEDPAMKSLLERSRLVSVSRSL